MNSALNIAIVVAIVATTLVLIAGIWSLFRGGPNSGNRSNRLMRWRVLLQAIAVALIALASFIIGRPG